MVRGGDSLLFGFRNYVYGCNMELRNCFRIYWGESETTVKSISITDTTRKTVQISLALHSFWPDQHGVGSLEELVMEFDVESAKEIRKNIDIAILNTTIEEKPNET